MIIDLTNRQFGRLRVIARSTRRRRWYCHCNCGNFSEPFYDSLVSGEVKSCGCWNQEARCQRFTAMNWKHGLSQRRRKVPEYGVWNQMIQRCYNPRTSYYASYGGRGIRVCDRWRYSFADFYADMGPRPVGASIDRIDNNGDYDPGNCRWATLLQQNENKRSNHHVLIAGTKMTIARLARLLGTGADYFRRLSRAGVPPEEIFVQAHFSALRSHKPFAYDAFDEEQH